MIHIHKSKNKPSQFYVVVKSRNGSVLSTSETFKRKASAYKNIWSLIKVLKAVPKIKDHTV